ncbi:hypothetical protein [Szabonella alba]|uniref:Uncharacterized protein n=1 Tax=Szabonella alba TaxID=2804194 RepID=A0A8K0Y0N4_9RHOB|nr:hypothetical protein [Szabonella alba]MBL4917027.1 hypothetical protein [Szabonella alba]
MVPQRLHHATLIIWLLAGMALAGVQRAEAQSVRVTSGEHDGFSRIVLQYSTATDWRLSRTETGYALATGGPPPRYDLTNVFRLIPRDRLTAIFADPADGGLRLGIGCACHILPFELRPGLVVLDIRDGPPPEGSSFERTAAGDIAPPLQISFRPPARPAARPGDPPDRPALPPETGALNWRQDVAEASRLAPPAQDLPLPTPGLEETRDAILRELARGVAEGVVDVTQDLPGATRPPPGGRVDSHIRIGPEAPAAPGIDPAAARRLPGMLTADGRDCIADDRLDLSGWGREGDVAATIGLLRGRLLGEFDRPDPDATAEAIRYFLHLGFGAEARGLIDSFEIALPDADLWRGLALLLDGEAPDPDVFAGMQVCDSAAALWAALGLADLSRHPMTDRAAVARGFSALPLHLRHHLGPRLAETFRAAGDLSTASAIRDAILRAPGDPGPEVRLMEAGLRLARQDANEADLAARPLLEPIMAGSGPSAIEATVALIEAEIAAGRVAGADLTTTAAAFLHEAGNSERAGPLASALALALASQSRLDEGLALSPLSPGTEQRAWSVFAETARQDALLAAAVGRNPVEITRQPPETRLIVAERLEQAGLQRPALDWLAGLEGTAARLARARAHTGLRDWRAVLRGLAGLEDETALRLRARAFAALGDPGALALLAGPDAAGERRETAKRLEAWPALSNQGDDDIWGRAAALVTRGNASRDPASAPPAEPADDPPDAPAPPDSPEAPVEDETGDPGNNLQAQDATGELETARQLIEESRAARATIKALLTALP